MAGGAGNDTYIVDNTGDVVTEAANAGTDLVYSSVTYTLTANVENLTLTGSSNINGTGNTLILLPVIAVIISERWCRRRHDVGRYRNDTYVVDNAVMW